MFSFAPPILPLYLTEDQEKFLNISKMFFIHWPLLYMRFHLVVHLYQRIPNNAWRIIKQRPHLLVAYVPVTGANESK